MTMDYNIGLWNSVFKVIFHSVQKVSLYLRYDGNASHQCPVRMFHTFCPPGGATRVGHYYQVIQIVFYVFRIRFPVILKEFGEGYAVLICVIAVK